MSISACGESYVRMYSRRNVFIPAFFLHTSAAMSGRLSEVPVSSDNHGRGVDRVNLDFAFYTAFLLSTPSPPK